MKKLRLCGIAEEQTQLIRELQLLGSVEIGSPEALTGAQQTQIFRAGDSSSADALSRTSAALASALETLKQYETKKAVCSPPARKRRSTSCLTTMRTAQPFRQHRMRWKRRMRAAAIRQKKQTLGTS